MKAEIKIPDGWRRVRTGGIIRRFDKFWLASIREWVRTMSPGCRADRAIQYIRKIQSKKAGPK